MARKPSSVRGAASPGDRAPANTLAPSQARPPPRRAPRGAAPAAAPWSALVTALTESIRSRPRPQIADRPVVTLGALPGELAGQYHAQPGFLRRHIDYYEGDAATYPAFRDRGAKLVAYQIDPTTVASLLAIARHRHWKDLHVTGDRPFRRAVWLEAARAGLRVQGYRPSPRDRDAVSMLEQSPPPVERSSAPKLEPASKREAAQRGFAPARTFQQGVSGLLVEHGHAPYQNQPGAKSTPFVRVNIGAARPFEVWGVDLSRALQAAKIKSGDPITLSWHGADYGDIRVQKAQIAQTAPRQQSARPEKTVHGVYPKEPSRDPAVTAAQAHLAVVEAVARAKLTQPKDRAQIGAAAKAKLAEHRARGSDFTLARVIERAVRPTPDLGQRPSPAPNRER